MCVSYRRMTRMHDIRHAILRALRRTIGPVTGACLVAYFAYFGVYGDRGLLALRQTQGEVTEARTLLADMRLERLRLEHRSGLLRPDRLDQDMLEERARLVLNYSHPDEMVILLDGSRHAGVRTTPY